MKKTTQLCSLVFAALVAVTSQVTAQITITQSDMPYSGLKVITATDSTSGYLPGNPSATAQTWNFNALNHQKTASISFMPPSSTKYSSDFPGANLADSTIGTIGYNFFTVNSTEFAVEGVEELVTDATYGITFQIEINLNPEFVQSNLPATYGDIINGVSKGKDEFAPELRLVCFMIP